MKKLPLSVFIIAKDEADRIEKPILSVRDWVDEVIVIDSGSKDETVSVSDKLGAKVVFHEWKGYGPQKVFGESLCKNEWLLNIDADEEISEELAENIRKIFEPGAPAANAYRINIKMLFPYEKQPPFFAPGYKQIRLYNRKFAGFKDSTVHDSVVVKEGSVEVMKGLVLHRSVRNWKHWCDKVNSYSTMQAEDFIKQGRKPYAARIILEWPFAFLKSYILRRYFLYGVDGFVASFLYAYGRMLRIAKAREIIKREKK